MILYRGMLFAGIVFFFTVSSFAQTKVWTRMSGTSLEDWGNGVAVDANGWNVYVAGYTQGPLDGQPNGGNTVMCLLKYDSSGTKQWTRLCGAGIGTGNAVIGIGVAVDESGNAYMVGYTSAAFDSQTYAGGQEDICLVKYDSNGTKQWTRLCGTSGYDVGLGVAVDKNANVYITGSTAGMLDGQAYAGGSGDICVVKYDSSGIKQWTRLCGSSNDEIGYGVVVNAKGEVYITGNATASIDGQPYAGINDIVLIKYNSNGTKLWTRMCGNVGRDYGFGVAVDARGNVYVGGYTTTTLDGQAYAGGSADICIVKYDSSGTKQWTRLCGSDNEDRVFGIAVDTGGNSYLAGYVFGGSFDGQTNAGYADICLVKYNSMGTRQWTRFCGSSGWNDSRSVACDVGGNIYVAGKTYDAMDGQPFAGAIDMCLVKYSPQTTWIQVPIVRPAQRVRENDVQMFDIFGRKITGKDLSRRPVSVYIVQSVQGCEKKILLK